MGIKSLTTVQKIDTYLNILEDQCNKLVAQLNTAETSEPENWEDNLVESTEDLSKRFNRLHSIIDTLKKANKDYHKKYEVMGESEKQKLINNTINTLSSYSLPNAYDYAINTYNANFFRSLTDISFKIDFAKTLIDFFGPGKTLELWIKIVNQDSSTYHVLYGEK